MQSIQVSQRSTEAASRRDRLVAHQTFSAELKGGEWVATVATVFDDGTAQRFECGHRESRRKALQDIERVLLEEAYPDPPDF